METDVFIVSKVRNKILEVQILMFLVLFAVSCIIILGKDFFMANTFTQIHIQLVFATQFRKSQISPSWELRLYEYIIGIFNFYGHRVLSINGMPDHIHILFGFRPDQSLSDLVQKVKASSSKWINEERLSSSKFAWQAGYGAFSYTKSDLPKVIRYIQNQKEHHQRKTFHEEYLKILSDLEIEFDPKYTFKDLI